MLVLVVVPEVYKQLWTKCQLQNQHKGFLVTCYCVPWGYVYRKCLDE